jgi:hypothetical protein
MGRPRSADEVDGLEDGRGDGVAGAPKEGGGGGARDGGGGADKLDIGDGDGDLVRERDCSWRRLNRLVRISCSNSWVREAASYSLGDCVRLPSAIVEGRSHGRLQSR